jgi:predicted AlkP superfamily phosphohydrolase/phosphomutase
MACIWLRRGVSPRILPLLAIGCLLSLWALVAIAGAAALGRGARRWPRTTVTLAVALVAAAGWSAARHPRLREAEAGAGPFTAPRPVLLVGVDAASWSNLEPLLREGRLPTLARLRAAGAWGELQSLRQILSPVVWTTIVTGVDPETHGILDFVHDGVPYTSNSRRAPALWEILPRYGQRGAFLYWWVSWPAEPVAGLIVTDRFLFGDLPQRVNPEQATAEFDALAEAARREAPGVRSLLGAGGGPDDPGLAQRHRVRLEVLREFLERDEIVTALGERVLSRGGFDLVGVYLRGPDAAGHKFWQWHYRRRSPRVGSWVFGPADADQPVLEGVVDGMNELVDRQLGRLLQAVGPGANVVVVSDHGMRAAKRLSQHREGESASETGNHHRSGLLLLAGPDIRPGTVIRAASVYDVFPTILHLLGLPVPRDLPGRVLVEALRDEARESRPMLRTPSFGSRAQADHTPIPTEMDREYLDRLKALGYLGE